MRHLRLPLALAISLTALAHGQPDPATPPANQPANPPANQPEPPAQPAEAANTELFSLDGCNVGLKLPKGRWKSTPSEVKGFAQWNRATNQSLFVRTEPLSGAGPQDLAALEDVLALGHSKDADSVTHDGSAPLTVAGIPGRRFKLTIKSKTVQTRIDNWIAVSNGVMYRVAVSGPRSGALFLSSELDRALEGFSLLDPAYAGTLRHEPVAPPLSLPALGLRVSWPESLRLQRDLSTPKGRAEAGILLSEGCWTFFEAFAAELPGAGLTDEDLFRAVQHLWNFTPDGPWQAAAPGPEGVQSWSVGRTPTPASHPVATRHRIVRKGDSFIIARAWSVRREGGDEDAKALLDGIDPAAIRAAAPPLDALSKTERFYHSVLLAQAGIARRDAGNHAEAVALLRRAVDFDPTDASVSDAALELMVDLGQFREAAAVLDLIQAPADAKLAPAFWARAARIRAQLGDVAAATAAYEKFFATGKRDDDILDAYVGLLNESDKPQDALDAIERFGSGNPDRYLAPRAHALASLGRPDDAVALLKPRAEEDPDLLWAYLDLLLEIDRHAEVLAECDRRLTLPAARRIGLLFRKGQAEMGLRWFAKARDSFDAVLKESPGNATVTSWLDAASRAMGQGDRTLLSHTTEPVPLPADLASQPPAPAEFPDEPVLVLLDARCVAFSPQKAMKTTSYLTRKAQTRSALDALSTLEVEFDPAFERLCIHSAAVIAQDGARSPADPATFYITDAQAGDASSAKIAVIPVPGVAVGATVELIFTHERINPGDAIEFGVYRLDGRDPALTRLLRIQAPRDSFSFKTFADAAPVEKPDGVEFMLRNRPPMLAEPAPGPFWEDSAVVAVGPAGRTWDAVGRDYLRSIQAPLSAPAPAKLREILDRIDRPDAPAAERVGALARFVQRELTYRFIAFGPRASIPRPAAEPLKERAGDCKDHAVVLWSLLNQAGIPAHLALYSTGLPPQESLPDLDAFDHMVVFVPSVDGGRFVDPTPDESDPMFAAHTIHAETAALILDPAGPRLAPVAVRALPGQGVTIARSVAVTADGAALVEETVTATGSPAQYYRARLGAAPDERARWVQKIFASAAGQPRILSFAFDDADDTSKPVVMRVTYAVDAAFRAEPGALAGRLPMGFEESLLDAEAVEHRRRSVVLSEWSITSRTTVRTPAGFTPPEAPAEFSRETPAVRTLVRAAADGDARTLVVSCTDIPGRYPADAWAPYVKAVRETASQLARPIRFTAAP